MRFHYNDYYILRERLYFPLWRILRFTELKTEVLLALEGQLPEEVKQLLQELSKFQFENDVSMPFAKVSDALKSVSLPIAAIILTTSFRSISYFQLAINLRSTYSFRFSRDFDKSRLLFCGILMFNH